MQCAFIQDGRGTRICTQMHADTTSNRQDSLPHWCSVARAFISRSAYDNATRRICDHYCIQPHTPVTCPHPVPGDVKALQHQSLRRTLRSTSPPRTSHCFSTPHLPRCRLRQCLRQQQECRYEDITHANKHRHLSDLSSCISFSTVVYHSLQDGQSPHTEAPRGLGPRMR